jgi:hypothetical protein
MCSAQKAGVVIAFLPLRSLPIRLRFHRTARSGYPHALDKHVIDLDPVAILIAELLFLVSTVRAAAGIGEHVRPIKPGEILHDTPSCDWLIEAYAL